MQLDLNLLPSLEALIEEQSVTAAAARMHVSVPAMSRTLGRIRRATGDPILVRAGRSMVTTPYADRVQVEVSAVLARAQAVLALRRTVDPATLERVFTLEVHDALATAIAPALIAAVGSEAPGVQLRLLAESAADTDDLRVGRVDLEVGSGGRPPSEFCSQTLGADKLVVVGCQDHPAFRADLTPATYASQRHLTVSRRGRLHDPVDHVLADHGLTRRVTAAAPTVSAALAMVACSDLLVLAPKRACQAAITQLGLQTAPVPVAVSPIPVIVSWHQRHQDDAAHAYLRGHVRRSVQALGLCTAPTPEG